MPTPTLADAIALAKRAHADQMDKAGAPYFGHLERVMNRVEGDDLKIIAVLHDSLEDTDGSTPVHITRDYLQNHGYPEPIIAAIEALTKLPQEEGSTKGYLHFIQRAAQNPLARPVKIADLQDNMDLSRLESPTAKDRERREKYRLALEYLETWPQTNQISSD